MDVVVEETNTHPTPIAAACKPAKIVGIELLLGAYANPAKAPFDVARTTMEFGTFSSVVGLPKPSLTPTPLR